MKRIVYLSAATALPSVAALDAILADARPWNIRHAVTGLLLYHDGAFLQCLEGPEAGVEATYEKISRASQHTRMLRVLETETDARLFPDWAMGFERPSGGAEAGAFEALCQAGGRMLTDGPDARELGVLLGSFLRSFRGLKAA